jgi:PAS domain S-box-containing protein
VIPTGESIALGALARALTARELEEGALRLLNAMQGSLSVSGGLVFLRESEGAPGRALAYRGVSGEWVAEWERDEPPAIKKRLTAGLVHEPRDSTVGHLDPRLKSDGITAAWTLPLGSARAPIGAIVFVSTDDNPFANGCRETLVVVAEAFGAWLEARTIQERLALLQRRAQTAEEQLGGVRMQSEKGRVSVEEARGEVERVRAEAATEREELARAREELTKERESASSLREELEREREASRAAGEEADRRNADTDELRHFAEQASKEADQARTERERLIRERDEARTEIDDARSEIARIRSESDVDRATAERAESAEKEAAASRAEVERMRQDWDESREEAERTRKERDEARKELDDARTEIERIRKDIEDARAEVDRVRKERDDARAEADRIRKELDDARAEADRVRKELDEVRAEADRIRKELDGSGARVEQARDEAEQAREAAEHTRREIDEALADAERASADAIAAREETERLRKEMLRAREEAERLRADAAVPSDAPKRPSRSEEFSLIFPSVLPPIPIEAVDESASEPDEETSADASASNPASAHDPDDASVVEFDDMTGSARDREQGAGPNHELRDALLAQADLGVARLDREGRVLQWSPRASRVLGWKEDHILGKTLEPLFQDEDRREWMRRVDGLGSVGVGEWLVSLRTDSGDMVPCGVRLLFQAQSEEFVILVRSRRGAEAADQWLRWSRALLSVLGASTIVLDPGGRIRELGAGWLQRGEMDIPKWLGRHFAELFDTDRRDVLAALRTVAREGQWKGMFTAEGAVMTIRLRAVKDDRGNLEALVGARLPEVGNEARDLFRKIPVGMILVDRNFRVLEANPEVAAICGASAIPEDPIGVDVRSLAIFQTRASQTALESLKSGTEFDLPEVDLSAGDGVVQFRGKQLHGIDGDVSGYLLMLLSRNGKTQWEKHLVRAQKMESIGNFASGLAHDFGNFVSVILGKAGVLRVKLPNDPHIMGDIDDIETASKRAQHLSQELMRFARGGRNRVTQLSLNQLIEEVGSLIQTSVGKKIAVQFRLDNQAASVEGDEVELQQMVLNLCINARDAMESGGRLTIETRSLTPQQLERLGPDVDRGVCLMVKDNGIGMPPEVVERVFEPFFTTKDDPKGTGLGLAMVYGIVRRHKGTIDVYSQEGVGTTFEIVLPAASGSQEEPKRETPILVVDDEPAFREMIRLILEEDGHEVLLAANGIEALKTLRADYQKLGLVILDLRMPGLDGLGVLKELRELAPHLPVLVTTGYASDEEKKEALAQGAQRVLEKPYRVNDLRTALAELMSPEGAAKAAAVRQVAEDTRAALVQEARSLGAEGAEPATIEVDLDRSSESDERGA